MAREEESKVHESRMGLVPTGPRSQHTNYRKPHHARPAFPRKQHHDSSVNGVKKRIRDIHRKLDRYDDLPADVRRDDERALDTYEQELAVAEQLKRKSKMINRYKMVRFLGMSLINHKTYDTCLQSCRTYKD